MKMGNCGVPRGPHAYASDPDTAMVRRWPAIKTISTVTIDNISNNRMGRIVTTVCGS